MELNGVKIIENHLGMIMAQPFLNKYNEINGTKRGFIRFIRTDETKLFLEECKRHLELQDNDLILTENGYGSYLHPVVFVRFYLWLFPDDVFSVKNYFMLWFEYDLAFKELVEYLDERINETLEYDALCFHREIRLCSKFFSKKKNFDNQSVIDFNISLLSINVPFNDRYIAMARYFYK